RFVHRQRDVTHRRRVHGAVVLIGVAGVGEQPRDAGLDLAGGGATGSAGQIPQALFELGCAQLEVLGDVVKHLRPVVSRGGTPATALPGGLDGVTDVLTVAEWRLTEAVTASADD